MNAPDLIEEHNKHIAADYDRTPYVSNAFAYSAPGHLRATAHLYGIETVPLKQARVLELGCAAGGNLLPFALAYPEATVVGVDLSPVQIAQGQEVVRDLGLKHMRLHAMDLAQITPEFGQFDYIIAHGVFSWVPPEVKQAMLRICRENLSPLGIAYISYNTYPGWKAGDVVRDAMTLHCHGAQSEEERLGRAKAMLHMLSEGLASSHGMGGAIQQMAASLGKQSDYYIAHEYLERFNTPCYLVEFADVAAQAGLAYVGDAEAFSEVPANYGSNVQLQLSLMALGQSKVMRQQYLDFAVGRNFRKSLLVHQERGDAIAALPRREALRELRWAGKFTSYEDEHVDKEFRSYRGPGNRSLHTRDAGVMALIEILTAAWPQSLDYAQVLEHMRERLAPLDDEALRKQADEALERLYSMGMLRQALESSPYDAVGARVAQPLPGYVYLQRRAQEPGFALGTTNFWHESIRLEIIEAQTWLLEHAQDGLDRKAAVAMLAKALQQGTVKGPGDQSLQGQRNLEPLAQRIAGELLRAMHDNGLLLKG